MATVNQQQQEEQAAVHAMMQKVMHNSVIMGAVTLAWQHCYCCTAAMMSAGENENYSNGTTSICWLVDGNSTTKKVGSKQNTVASSQAQCCMLHFEQQPLWWCLQLLPNSQQQVMVSGELKGNHQSTCYYDSKQASKQHRDAEQSWVTGSVIVGVHCHHCHCHCHFRTWLSCCKTTRMALERQFLKMIQQTAMINQ